jgi:hypothetical protein
MQPPQVIFTIIVQPLSPPLFNQSDQRL